MGLVREFRIVRESRESVSFKTRGDVDPRAHPSGDEIAAGWMAAMLSNRTCSKAVGLMLFYPPLRSGSNALRASLYQPAGNRPNMSPTA